MLERRGAQRRRVCFEGTLACELTGSSEPVRIRNLSDRGAEIVAADGGQVSSFDVALHVRRADAWRRARVVWRRPDRVGLEFVAQASAGGEAARRTATDPFASLLAARAPGRAA